MIGAASGRFYYRAGAGRHRRRQQCRDRGFAYPRSYRLRAIACGALGVVVLLKESLPAGIAVRPRRGRITMLRDALGRKVLAQLLAIFFLTILAFAGMESTFALWAMAQLGWGPAQTGYLFTFVGLLWAVMQGGLIGRLTARFGEEKLLLAGLVSIAAGLLILPLAHDLPVLLVATAGLALGMGTMQPSLNSLISRRAGIEEQGEVMGWRNRSAACRACWGRFWRVRSLLGLAAISVLLRMVLVVERPSFVALAAGRPPPQRVPPQDWQSEAMQ